MLPHVRGGGIREKAFFYPLSDGVFFPVMLSFNGSGLEGEKGGRDALEIAFSNRLVSLIKKLEILRPDQKTLIVTIKTCRVQTARQRKGMAQFPCISVGMVEFPVFARTIDSRIVSTCLSCPPETQPGIPYCSWKFTLEGGE